MIDYGLIVTLIAVSSKISVTPLQGALGAVVEGLDVPSLSDGDLSDVAAELAALWSRFLVLFFPAIDLSPADQVRLAARFGSRLAATTETDSDYRKSPTLAEEGFPQILVLDSGTDRFDARQTAVWHTDVTFAANPPKGSLLCMEIPATSGGDTMWSNQMRAYESLSEPIRRLIGELTAVHGRPPLTGTTSHPMVITHHETGDPVLFVNRGFTSAINDLSSTESSNLLAAIFAIAERPEHQIRWKWSAGDAALWDNRYTMHYAVNDYAGQRRRVRRTTIYQD